MLNVYILVTQLGSVTVHLFMYWIEGTVNMGGGLLNFSNRLWGGSPDFCREYRGGLLKTKDNLEEACTNFD